MSVNILYFELKKQSIDYSGYKYVNQYNIPDIFESKKVSILYDKKNIIASEFGYGISSQIYNNNSNASFLRQELYKFLLERLNNPCIQPVLFIFIENNSNDIIQLDNFLKENIAIDAIFGIFKEKIFNGLFFIKTL